MGLFSHYVAYRLGRRRAERRAEQRAQRAAEAFDERDPDCLNYAVFCRSFGSCDGQVCEYADDPD